MEFLEKGSRLISMQVKISYQITVATMGHQVGRIEIKEITISILIKSKQVVK